MRCRAWSSPGSTSPPASCASSSMRWRTTTPSGSPARASRTCLSTAAERPVPPRTRAWRPRPPAWRRACSPGPRGTPAESRCSYPASMKVAVISDIHGNRHAFEATLEAIAASDAAELWCLGDLVGYGAEPDACVALAREHAAVCLAGNHDLGVRGSPPLEEFSRGAALAAKWTQTEITPETQAYLDRLEPVNLDEQV